MMENKCSKTPNSKFSDHVYCHSSESKNHLRTNNNAIGNGGGNANAGHDAITVLKENKQLKAMLILHMDLIQEQSDQLMAKDKVLSSLREEMENLKAKNIQLEAQVQELHKQLQRQMKRVAAGGGEVSTLPPPPLAKIQVKVETEPNALQSKRTEDIKHSQEDVLPKEKLSEKGTKLSKKNYKVQEDTTKPNDKQQVVGKKAKSIIGECNGKLISRIILHRVKAVGLCSPASTASDSTSEIEESSRQRGDECATVSSQPGDDAEHAEDGDDSCDSNENIPEERCIRTIAKLPTTASRGAKPRKQVPGTSSPTEVKINIIHTPPSRGGKQMPLMLTHAPDLHSDESASCDSTADGEQRTTCVSSPALSMSPKDAARQNPHTLAPPTHTLHNYHARARRCGYISTTQRYCTRAWEDEEFNCDVFTTGDVDALQAADLPPTLEVPKWTEYEIPVSYCIEGTEDLSDDTFLKRHAKLELDEKRRKKWDVQQIREQRRIEKLKRRHCKDEIQNAAEQQPLASFYPPPDAIQMICYVNELPVQAFGELIPKLSTNGGFMLPWLDTNNAASTSMEFNSVEILPLIKISTSSQQSQQLLNSSFVFMKKRRRQQSSSGVAANNRQRQTTATTSKTTVSTTATISSVGSQAMISNSNNSSADVNKN